MKVLHMKQLTIPRVILKYPRIYNPNKFPNNRERYGSGFRCDQEWKQKLTDEGCNYHVEKDIFNANSMFPPIITALTPDYSNLIKAVEILDARNIYRDALFIDIECQVKVDLYEYTSPNGLTSGVGICLKEVLLDLTNLPKIAINFRKTGHHDNT